MSVDTAWNVICRPHLYLSGGIARAASVIMDEWLRLRRENAKLRAQAAAMRVELDELEKELDALIIEVEAVCAADEAQVQA